MKLITVFIGMLIVGAAHGAAAQSLPDLMRAAVRNEVPADVNDSQISAALEKSLQRPDGAAVALVIPRAGPSIVLVLIRKADEGYLASDVSHVENLAFGYWGRKRKEYERWETTPVEWLPREDGQLQVLIRTRAWRNGQRYTAAEPLLIKPDGTPFFR